MLNCRELSTHHASAYLDGRLRLRQRLSVGIHLAVCSTCRRFMHQLGLVKSVLRKKPDVPFAGADSEALATRLKFAFQQQQKNSSDRL
jgi:predicted anti-sigma-YlaC factor YlaD